MMNMIVQFINTDMRKMSFYMIGLGIIYLFMFILKNENG